MPGLSTIFKGITGSQDLIGSAIGAISSSINAKKEREWNAEQAEINRTFQSNEAALQRDWSAAEAERARDWEEEMYDKYNSLSGKIQQAHEAGVNPMLAITGNAVSPMSTSSPMPSGASAGSVGNPTGSFVNIIGEMLGLQKLQAETKLINEQANLTGKQATGQQITNEQLREMNASEIMRNLSQVELNNANVALCASKVLNTDADTQVKSAQLGQIASQIANLEADTKVKAQQIGVLLTEIAKNNKSLEVMDAQVSEMLSVVGVNRAEASVLAQQFRNLVQENDIKGLEQKLNNMIEPSGDEKGFSALCYKIFGLLK